MTSCRSGQRGSEGQPERSEGNHKRSLWLSLSTAKLEVDVDDDPIFKIKLIFDWHAQFLGICECTFDHPVRAIAKVDTD